MLHPCCSGGLNAGKAQGKADAIRGVENNSCTSYQKAKIYVSCARAEFGIAAAMGHIQLGRVFPSLLQDYSQRSSKYYIINTVTITNP
jgi:hypothetical protein